MKYLFLLFLCTTVFAQNFDIFKKSNKEVIDYLTSNIVELQRQQKTTPTSQIIKQLERTSCWVNLVPQKTKIKTLPQNFTDNYQSSITFCSIYKCSNCTNWHVSASSGFIISPDGVIVTSYHAIKTNNQAFAVMTSNGEIYPIKEVLAADKSTDIAILKIDAKGLKPYPLSTKAPIIGQTIAMIHNPAMNFYMYNCGIISRIMHKNIGQEKIEMIQISADFARGSSGAAVIDDCGNVASMVRETVEIAAPSTKKLSKSHQMTIHNTVPSAEILKLIKPKPTKKSFFKRIDIIRYCRDAMLCVS